jgi:hypothetical protein
MMRKPRQQTASNDQPARGGKGPLARPRNWVLSIGGLIVLGILAYLIGGNVVGPIFAGALVAFVIAVIQRSRRKR